MAENGASSPPYGSFTNLWGFLEELSQRGPAPQVLEPGVYGNRAPAARWELQNALWFFGLIDKDKRPTAVGESMIEHPTVDTLATLLKEKYPRVIELGLENATPGQVDEALKAMGANEGGSLRKARTFFLHAAQKAGITVGPHLRTPIPAQRPTRRAKAQKPTPMREEQRASAQVDLKTRYVELLLAKIEKVDDPDEALLDRVERALGLGTSPASPRQGVGGESGEGEQLEDPHPAGH